MPQSLSKDKTGIIVNMLEKGMSRTQIADITGVSTRAVTRISTNIRKHGTVKAPPSGFKIGRPTSMSKEQAEAMLKWMSDHGYIFYVKDLAKFLRDNHGFQGCQGTVGRTMLRAGFTRRLPVKKNEVTAWKPPDHPVAWQTIANGDEERLYKSKTKLEGHANQLQVENSNENHTEVNLAFQATTTPRRPRTEDLPLDGTIDQTRSRSSECQALVSPQPRQNEPQIPSRPPPLLDKPARNTTKPSNHSSPVHDVRPAPAVTSVVDPRLTAAVPPLPKSPSSTLMIEASPPRESESHIRSTSQSATPDVVALQHKVAAQEELIQQLQRQLAERNSGARVPTSNDGALTALERLAEQAARSA